MPLQIKFRVLHVTIIPPAPGGNNSNWQYTFQAFANDPTVYDSEAEAENFIRTIRNPDIFVIQKEYQNFP